MGEFPFLSDVAAPFLAALVGLISSVGTWFIGVRKLRVSAEQSREKVIAELSVGEQAERAHFRTTLISDIANLRQLQKECESDRDHLRNRINATEEQILVLKASAEIMQRWLSFFKAAETAVPGTLTTLMATLPLPVTLPLTGQAEGLR